MNGFSHTILSIVLSWIRTLIANLWEMATSENGGAMYRFLSQNWLKIVAAVCIAGMAVDLIVYFFRWRPDYIWRSRMHRRRRAAEETPEPEPQMHHETQVYRPVSADAYAPLHQRGMVYAPTVDATQTYAPLQEMEPLFDEAAPEWDAPAPVQTEWQPQELPVYGAARPEPATLYHDIQAGYAPAVPPEQLYVPSASYQSPVHPGLDEHAFRQSFGLQTDEEAMQDHAVPVVRAPAFRPFTVKDEPEEEARTPSRLSRLARRARTFVGVEDEAQLTIHDLQSTVDVSQAFHAPVYPQPLDKGGYEA